MVEGAVFENRFTGRTIGRQGHKQRIETFSTVSVSVNQQGDQCRLSKILSSYLRPDFLFSI